MHLVTLALIVALVLTVIGAALYWWADGRSPTARRFDNWYYASLWVFWSGVIASVVLGIVAIVGAAGSYSCERLADGIEREYRWGHAVGCQVKTHDGWVDYDKLRISSTLNEEDE